MSQELSPDIRAALGMPTEAEEERQRKEAAARLGAHLAALAREADEIKNAKWSVPPAAAGSGARGEADTVVDYVEAARSFGAARSVDEKRAAGKALKLAAAAITNPAPALLALLPPGEVVPNRREMRGGMGVGPYSPKSTRAVGKWIDANYSRLRWLYLKEFNGGEVRCHLCRDHYHVEVRLSDDVEVIAEPGIGIVSKPGRGVDTREALSPNDDVLFVCADCFERDPERFYAGGASVWAEAPVTTPWDDALRHAVSGSYGSRG